jgi:hypothetical protein
MSGRVHIDAQNVEGGAHQGVQEEYLLAEKESLSIVSGGVLPVWVTLDLCQILCRKATAMNC